MRRFSFFQLCLYFKKWSDSRASRAPEVVIRTHTWIKSAFFLQPPISVSDPLSRLTRRPPRISGTFVWTCVFQTLRPKCSTITTFPSSLVGQDMWLSPTRPGFKSRLGNTFCLLSDQSTPLRHPFQGPPRGRRMQVG